MNDCSTPLNWMPLTARRAIQKHIPWCFVLTMLFPSLGASQILGHIRTVAYSGLPAQGTEGRFYYMEIPVIDDLGRTSFRAHIDQFVEGETIWSEAWGGAIARAGSVAPGISDGSIFVGSSNSADLLEFRPTPVVNRVGQMAYEAELQGPNVTDANRRGIWFVDGLGVRLLARTGDFAPGGDGAQFSSINLYDVLDSGDVLFGGYLTGDEVNSTNDQGTWIAGESGVTLLAREGAPAPGLPGTWYESVGASESVIVAQLAGPDITAVNDDAVFKGMAGDYLVVLREGSQAADLPQGVQYGAFVDVVANDSSQLAVRGVITGEGVTAANDRAIWAESAEAAMRLVARTGDTVGNVKFTNFGPLSINGPGQVAFFASNLGYPAQIIMTSVWLDDGSKLQLIANRRSPAPGTLFNFTSFPLQNVYAGPLMNDAGQVAFFAQVNGRSLLDDSNALDGIWATDRSGHLQLVAIEGSQIEVAPGDFRTIGGLLTDNVNMSRIWGMNSRGQITFQAAFTDGSVGEFVSDVVAIPEPHAPCSMLIGCAMVGTWRKCRKRKSEPFAGSQHSSRIDLLESLTADPVHIVYGE